MGIQVGEHNTLRISEHSRDMQNNVNTVLFPLITNFLRCDILSATMFKIGKEGTGGTCACTTNAYIGGPKNKASAETVKCCHGIWNPWLPTYCSAHTGQAVVHTLSLLAHDQQNKPSCTA